MIHYLRKRKLIRFRGTTRWKRYPRRAVYELTRKGRETAVRWMQETLSTIAPEFPEFPCALAYIPLISVEDAAARLEQRARALDSQLEDVEGQLRDRRPNTPRAALLELEYLRVMVRTELSWVRSAVKDLKSGDLIWSGASNNPVPE